MAVVRINQNRGGFLRNQCVATVESNRQSSPCAHREVPWPASHSTQPVSAASRFDPQCFRVLLLRRFWCQLPLSSATCRCGQPLDSRGHHRGACATAGVLGRRGYPLESCAARICREAGATVSVNIRVQDLDLLPVPGADNCRLEVVPVCPSFTAHSWPWTPRWSAQCEQTELPGTYPELTGEHGRARLVVFEEDGPRSPTRSSGSWPERGPGQSPVKCELQQEGHGLDGGALLWRVAPSRRSPCWNVEEVWGLMGRSRQPLTSSGMIVTGRSSRLAPMFF